MDSVPFWSVHESEESLLELASGADKFTAANDAYGQYATVTCRKRVAGGSQAVIEVTSDSKRPQNANIGLQALQTALSGSIGQSAPSIPAPNQWAPQAPPLPNWTTTFQVPPIDARSTAPAPVLDVDNDWDDYLDFEIPAVTPYEEPVDAIAEAKALAEQAASAVQDLTGSGILGAPDPALSVSSRLPPVFPGTGWSSGLAGELSPEGAKRFVAGWKFPHWVKTYDQAHNWADYHRRETGGAFSWFYGLVAHEVDKLRSASGGVVYD